MFNFPRTSHGHEPGGPCMHMIFSSINPHTGKQLNTCKNTAHWHPQGWLQPPDAALDQSWRANKKSCDALLNSKCDAKHMVDLEDYKP
eukprot:3688787-Amphidinium_carterae.1